MNGAAPLGYSDEIKIKEKIKNDKALIIQGEFYDLTFNPLFSSQKN